MKTFKNILCPSVFLSAKFKKGPILIIEKPVCTQYDVKEVYHPARHMCICRITLFTLSLLLAYEYRDYLRSGIFH